MTRYRMSFLVISTLLVLGPVLLAQPAVEWTYTYDARGRLVRVTDSGGNVRRYVYDASGNLVSIQHTTIEQLLPPGITRVTPEHIALSVGEEVALQITGTALQEAFVSSDNAGLQIHRRNATARRLDLTLLAVEGIRPGPTTLIVTSPDGSAATTIDIEVIVRIREEHRIAAGDSGLENATLLVENARLVIEGSHTFAHLQLTGSTMLVHGQGPIVAQRVSLQDGSVLSHAANPSHLQLQVTELYIDASSRIEASGRGFPGGRQAGNPQERGQTIAGQVGSALANGGSYGGLGGEVLPGANPVYGEIRNPQAPGSGGGGGGATNPGGHGGGLVRITATAVTLDGRIQANGEASSSGGGGSGGGVWLHTTTLHGNGHISTDGGESRHGGGGGGGRITILAGETTLPVEHLSASGGVGAVNGGAGTIFIRRAMAIHGDVYIANAGRTAPPASTPLLALGSGTVSALTSTSISDASARFPVPDPRTEAAGLVGMTFTLGQTPTRVFTVIDNTATTLHIAPDDGDLRGFTHVGDHYRGISEFDTVTITAGASLQSTDRLAATTLTLTDGVLVADGSVQATTMTVAGLLTHSPTSLSREGGLEVEGTTLTVQATGHIDGSQRGYLGGFQGSNVQPAGYTQGNVPGSTRSNGGGYGGFGGLLAGTLPPTYGDFAAPVDLGSGGGGSVMGPGGNGGGRLRITAGTLNVAGAIRANGMDSTAGGGGSGGSVYITATTLHGDGQIQANGGASDEGGGGGGGRLALLVETFTLPRSHLSVAGGDGAVPGNVGTLFLQPRGVISPAPTVASITPARGASSGGTVVQVSGADFRSGATLHFGRQMATAVVVHTATTLSAVVPQGAAGAVDIVVANPEGRQGVLANGFTYVDDLVGVTGISPAIGSREGGTPVTITGEGFVAGVIVRFGEASAREVVVVSRTMVTAVTPPGQGGAVDVEVLHPTSGNSAALTDGFVYATVLPANTVIGASNTTFDNQDLLVEAGTVTMAGAHTLRSLTLNHGAVLTQPATTASTLPAPLFLTVTTRLHVDADSRIDVSGRGFLGGHSETNPADSGRTLGNRPGSGSGTGGSYGGLGGLGSTGNAAAVVYDDLRQPQHPGSGGGAEPGGVGGNGGGQLRLTAAEIFLEGAILANGFAGRGATGAGGSGGAIWISADTLSGNGQIQASGGGTESPESGSGGGGRIALFVEAMSPAILSNTQARGGAARRGAHGAAGTIFVRQAGQQDGDLIVDNGGLDGAVTPLRAIGLGNSTALTATTLRDDTAAFAVPAPAIGALGVIGLRINPNIQQTRTFSVVANTATTLLVAAPDDFTLLADILDTYLGVYTFENVFIRGSARVVTADAVNVRFLLALENASSLTSNVQVVDNLLPMLVSERQQQRDILITLLEPVAFPSRIVVVSGDPAIATVTTTTVIPAGQRTGVVRVALGEPGATTLTISAASQLLVIRVLVEQPAVPGAAVVAQAGAFSPETALLAQVPVLVAPVATPTVTLHGTEAANVLLPIPIPVPPGGAIVVATSDHPGIATVSAPRRLGAGEQQIPLRITGVAPGRTVVRGRVGASTFQLQVLIDTPAPVLLSAAPVLLFRPLSEPSATAVSAPVPVPLPALGWAGSEQPEPTLAPIVKIEVIP